MFDYFFLTDLFIEDQTLDLDVFPVLFVAVLEFKHTLILKEGPPDMVRGVVVKVIELVEFVADLVGEVVAGLAVAFEFPLNLFEEFVVGKVARDNDGMGLRGSSLLEAEAASNGDAIVGRGAETVHLLRR